MFHILITDDNPNILMELQEMVDWEDFDCEVVAACKDGESTIRAVEIHHPDIIITDISMPGMSGLDLAEYLCRHHPDIKVVLMSSYSEFEYAQRGLQLGVCDYLLKPVKYDNIVTVMKKITDGMLEDSLRHAEKHGSRKSLSELFRGVQERYLLQLLLVGDKEEKVLFNINTLKWKNMPVHPVIFLAHVFFLSNKKESSIKDVKKLAMVLKEKKADSTYELFILQAQKDSLEFLFIGTRYTEREVQSWLAQLVIDVQYSLKGELIIGISEMGTQYKELQSLYLQACYACRKSKQNAITLFQEITELSDGVEDSVEDGKKDDSGDDAHTEKVELIDRTGHTENIRKMCHYIEQHFMENITIKSVSSQVYLSPGYANSLFRQECGMTIFEYVLKVRIKNAKHMLAETDKTISQISEDVGYGSKANFYLAFRRLTGYSPTEYRSINKIC